MTESLQGKVALVTGASRGAGRGIALELALAGCKVYITGRSRSGKSITQYTDLTLDDTRDYEKILKENLEAIYKRYPLKIDSILNSFNKELKENNESFFDLFKSCKEKDLLPMIVFHTDECITREIFNLIDKELYNREKEEYPFHYDILEKKKEYYEKYIEERKDYSSRIEIKTKDAITEKREKMLDYDKREKVPNGGKAMSEIMVDLLTMGMRTDTRGAIGDCSFYTWSDWCERSGGPYLHVNRVSIMPSELSESGFHTNPRQNQLFMNAEWKQLEAMIFYWSILELVQLMG